MRNKEDFPSVLRATALTDDAEEVIMACEHVGLPIVGVRFHPESIGTPCGKNLLRNFLAMT